MIDRAHLKQLMPHGTGKIIAEKIGVSQKTISNYLTGRTNSDKVEKAVLQHLGDLKKEKNKLLKRVYEEDINN